MYPENTCDFSWYLQDVSDYVLAETYEAYMDDRGPKHFSEIFWEANRRGLTLDDLEQILIDNRNQ